MINDSTLTARCGYANFIYGSVNVFLKFDVHYPLRGYSVLRYGIKTSKGIMNRIVIVWFVICGWIPFKWYGLKKYWAMPFFLCRDFLNCNWMWFVVCNNETKMAAISSKPSNRRASLFRFFIFMPYSSSGVISTSKGY